MIPLQKNKHKYSEVKFRQKLVKQHKGLKTYYQYASNEKSILKWLKGRVEVTDKIFQKLSQKYCLSPYLEIGAEKAERAGLLQSKYKAKGIALDISYDSIESASYFFPKIGLSKKPLRICADCTNLPFLDNSFAFVFCFQTLHHFPHPKPIMEEVKRVLKPNGIFYFGEEPVMQGLNLNLWRRDYHLKPFEKLLKYMLILPFISKIGKSEVEHGVLEETPTFKIWEEAINIFPNAKVKLLTYPEFVASYELQKPKKGNNWLKAPFLQNLLFWALGAGINVLAYKEKPATFSKKTVKVNLYNLLACPLCKIKLKQTKTVISCPKCQDKFPMKNNVLFLLTKTLRRKWYGAEFR